MTIDEAIKYLNNPLSWAIGKTLEQQIADNKEATQMAIDALEKQRWIPCSKRQPDKEGDYLVTLLDDGRTWVEIALWNETFGGRWQAVLYNDVDYSDISNVIAWMPLPEPYQEGEQE